MTVSDSITATISSVETLTGASENDVITLSSGYTGAYIDLGGGSDSVTFAGGGTVTLAHIENISTSSSASASNVVVLDERTTDVSYIDLGAGNDTITMGLGLNTVYGGTGFDEFIFTTIDQSTGSRTDVIADFTHSNDHIVFQGLLTGAFNYIGAGTSDSAYSTSEPMRKPITTIRATSFTSTPMATMSPTWSSRSAASTPRPWKPATSSGVDAAQAPRRGRP